MERADILIGGGNLAGLSLAIALKQGLGERFSVVVADPMLERASGDARASAIAAAARRLFETVGAWEAIAQDAQPILDMVVTDSRLDDTIRPTFLTFEGEIAPGEPFAHMIENGPLVAALLKRAREAGVDLRALAVSGFTHENERVVARLSDGAEVSVRLLVAADGARSAAIRHRHDRRA
jgi:2-octaprenyl-6-methoxyphenol hydroxylase